MVIIDNETWYTKKEFLERLPQGIRITSTHTLQGMIDRGAIKALQIGNVWHISETMFKKIYKPNSYKETTPL